MVWGIPDIVPHIYKHFNCEIILWFSLRNMISKERNILLVLYLSIIVCVEFTKSGKQNFHSEKRK